MTTYIVRRLLITVPSLFALTFVIFMIIQIAPGDFFDQWALQPDLDQRQLRQWKREFGADKGWGVQYLKWLRGVLFDIRFSRERVRIADFEYDDLAENREAYKVTGSATAILVKRSVDGTFGLGFNFYAPGQVGALNRMDNPNPGSERPSNHWSHNDYLALEMEVRNDRVAGVDILLRLGDHQGRGLVERRFVRVDEPAEITLADADYARFQADRHRLKGLLLRAEQHGGTPALLQISCNAGNTVLTSWRYRLDPTQRRTLVRNHFPPWLQDPDRCDRMTLEIVPEPSPEMTVAVAFQDLDSNVHVTETALPADVTRTLSVDFADLRAAGVDTTRMRSISFRSDAPGSLFVDEIRLVRAGSGFHIGMPDFGRSIANRQPVWITMWPFLKNTMLLNILAIIFTWLLSLPIGIYSATRPYSWSDKAFGFLAYMGMAIPGFFFALLLLYAVTMTYDLSPAHPLYELLPIGGLTSSNYHELDTWERMMDMATHLILPVLVLGTGSMAALVRVLRAEFLDKSHMQFVVTARAKGLSPAMVNYKHILRNAIAPFVAGFGSMLPTIISGSALVEIVFGYPGIGQLMLSALRSHDIYLVMASTLAAGLLLVVGNLLADILLAWVDPRISYS